MKIRRIAGAGGGIGGSGIYGGVGAGVICDADNNSMYCTLTKFTSAIMQILFLFMVLYFIWTIVIPYFSSGIKKIGGGKGGRI